MSLKKDIPRYEDRPSVIGRTSRKNAEIIDATLTPQQHRQAIKKQLEPYDVATARIMVNEILEEITAEREKAQELRQQRTAENKAVHASQHEPINRYAAAHNSNDPTQLIEFFQRENTEVLQSVLTEITAAPRRWNSVFHSEIARAIQDLKSEIASRQSQPAPSVIDRIKQSLGR